MLQFHAEDGGRPLVNDDFEVIQSETYYTIFGQFMNLPPCVVAGCQVYDLGGGNYDVGAGLVYIDAGIHRFPGASSVTLPLELRLGALVGSDSRPYETGGSKDCMQERQLEAGPVSAAAGAKVLVTPDGALRFEKAREALLRAPNELRVLAAIDPALYDANGRGKYGTAAYGWQWCNGKGGAIDMGGLFPVAQALPGSGAVTQTDYTTAGAKGGAAQVRLDETQMPAHSHQMDQAGAHTHNVAFYHLNHSGDDGSTRYDIDPGVNRDRNITTTSAGDHVHTLQNTGGGLPHENRPPYITLPWEQWVGLN